MLFLWLFVNFVGKNVFFPHIKWVDVFIESSKNKILQIVFAVRNAMFFIGLENLRSNQFYGTLNSDIPKPDGVILACSVE